MGMSNFMQHVRELQAQVETMPKVARAKLEQLVKQGTRAQLAPDGEKWAPVVALKAIERGVDQDIMRPFDPDHHIAYTAVIEGKEIELKSPHKAAGFTRFGTKHMKSRAKVPNSDDLGWWLPKLMAALRGHIRNKRRMGTPGV